MRTERYPSLREALRQPGKRIKWKGPHREFLHVEFLEGSNVVNVVYIYADVAASVMMRRKHQRQGRGTAMMYCVLCEACRRGVEYLTASGPSDALYSLFWKLAEQGFLSPAATYREVGGVSSRVARWRVECDAIRKHM